MKTKTIFFCTECGNEASKWLGRCPGCGEWNTMVEQKVEKESRSAGSGFVRSAPAPKPLKDIESGGEQRYKTNISELDRVLGGGMVKAAWFKRYRENELPERFDRIVQSWDTANKV